MNLKERLAEILRAEYGIETRSQLIESVNKLGGLDVTVFCSNNLKKECKNDGKDH